VDDASNMRQQSQIREQKLNDQALKLIQDAANKQLELAKQRETGLSTARTVWGFVQFCMTVRQMDT